MKTLILLLFISVTSLAQQRDTIKVKLLVSDTTNNGDNPPDMNAAWWTNAYLVRERHSASAEGWSAAEPCMRGYHYWRDVAILGLDKKPIPKKYCVWISK